jgi:hypothetical protein
VDKNAFLAKMISSLNQVWFLSRPRRFGKSLTVSTLKTIFSGKWELFKGLAIESRLDEELFAPRPVIRLDMTRLTLNKTVGAFEESLGLLTAKYI